MEKQSKLNLDAWLKHRGRFKNFLVRRLGNKEYAEDILQSGVMKALIRADTPQREEDFVPWFYTVLRHAAVDHYRREGVRRAALPKWVAEKELDLLRGEPDFQALCRCLRPLLQTMKVEQARLLQDVDLKGIAPDKVAANMGISANNLRVRLFRARQGLKAKLKVACGSCSDHHCLDCHCRLKKGV